MDTHQITRKLYNADEMNWRLMYKKTVETEVIHRFTWHNQNYEIVSLTRNHLYCNATWKEYYVQIENKPETENFEKFIGYKFNKGKDLIKKRPDSFNQKYPHHTTTSDR